MWDRQAGENVKVSTDGKSGLYVIINCDQLEEVTKALDHNKVRYDVDRDAINQNSTPVMAVVNLGKGADVDLIQKILDSFTKS